MATQSRALQIRVEAPDDLSPLAARISRFDPIRLEEIVARIGLTDPGAPITVRLVPEHSEIAKATPQWVAGFALGHESLVVLFPSRTLSYPYDAIEDVLQHEIAHVLISRAAAPQPVPRWFHEGLALITERSWGLEDRMRAMAALTRRVDPAALERIFQGGQSEQARAYAVAGAWMRDIVRRHGRDAPARVLREMSAGQPFSAAYARTTGETIDASAAVFWRDSWWYQVVPFATSSVVLWLGVTLLALLAVRMRRARNAVRRKTWEREEQERLSVPTQ